MKKIVALIVSIALVGAVFGISAGIEAVVPVSAEVAAPAAEAMDQVPLESPFKAPYELASQSIVGVELTTQSFVRNGRIVSDRATVGTGVVVEDGYVVTNYHVVTAGGNRMIDNINIIHGEDKYKAEFIAGDEATDIAVLKVEKLDAPAVKIGDSDEVSVGDWALVIGNPLGSEALINTLTIGVISGQNRDMTSTDRRTGKKVGTTMLQTNAAVNEGNSGGGLFNIRGELVGITSMKLSSNGYMGRASIEGIGLAIPSNIVKEVVDELIEYGEVKEKPTVRMGVQIRDFPSQAEEPTKDEIPASIWVVGVEKDSPAEAAGMLVDDFIMYADGERVKTSEELQARVQKHEEGETIEIQVYRIPNLLSVKEDEALPEGEYITFNVELKVLDAE